jgi:predicted DNA-binding protein
MSISDTVREIMENAINEIEYLDCELLAIAINERICTSLYISFAGCTKVTIYEPHPSGHVQTLYSFTDRSHPDMDDIDLTYAVDAIVGIQSIDKWKRSRKARKARKERKELNQ